MANTASPPIWSFKVAAEDVPAEGAHFDLDPDESVRTQLAAAAGLRSLSQLHAGFDVFRHGREGLQVTGEVSAIVGQNCVVTLEPIDSELVERIDLVFTPPGAHTLANPEGEATVAMSASEPPEMLVGGSVDLGLVATEFLLLGIDPYPRKEGAAFEGKTAGTPAANPFAALAALKKRPPGTQD